MPTAVATSRVTWQRPGPLVWAANGQGARSLNARSGSGRRGIAECAHSALPPFRQMLSGGRGLLGAARQGIHRLPAAVPNAVDRLIDSARGVTRTLRPAAQFVCRSSNTTRVSNPGGFDPRVEDQQVGLYGQGTDDVHHQAGAAGPLCQLARDHRRPCRSRLGSR